MTNKANIDHKHYPVEIAVWLWRKLKELRPEGERKNFLVAYDRLVSTFAKVAIGAGMGPRSPGVFVGVLSAGHFDRDQVADYIQDKLKGNINVVLSEFSVDEADEIHHFLLNNRPKLPIHLSIEMEGVAYMMLSISISAQLQSLDAGSCAVAIVSADQSMVGRL
jgi:hypothetical protein